MRYSGTVQNNVLIVTSLLTPHHPPTHRVEAMAAYLSRRGYVVTVLSPGGSVELAGTTHVRMASQELRLYSAVRRASRRKHAIISSLWWRMAECSLRMLYGGEPRSHFALCILRAYCTDRAFRAMVRSQDHVLITVPHYSLGMVGLLLRTRTVVYDVRDPLVHNPFERSRMSYLSRLFFQWAVDRADRFIATTEECATYYKRIGKTVLHMPNGTSLPRPSTPMVPRDPLKPYILIRYCGSLYADRRDNLLLFLRILEQLPLPAPVRLEILGSSAPIRSQHIPVLLREPLHDPRSYLHALMEADLLLNIQSSRQSAVSQISTKTYDYLYANRPMIHLGKSRENRRLIREHASAWFMMEDERTDGAALTRFLNESRTREYEVNESIRERYDRETLAKNLAPFFGNLTQKVPLHDVGSGLVSGPGDDGIEASPGA